MSGRRYSAAEVDAAVAAISDPERLTHAQEVVVHAAPSLQPVLLQALHEGGWFGDGSDRRVRAALAEPDAETREDLVRALLTEETRLGLLVGAVVGFELARELERPADPADGAPTSGDVAPASGDATSTTEHPARASPDPPPPTPPA